MSRLGDSIRAARIQKKMTEKQLAKKCGMAESVIRDIESGRRIVSDDQAQRILKILGVENPISNELEVASEPEVRLRPRPRAYVVPMAPEHPEQETAARQSSDAWLDALGGVVKRVPVIDENSVAVDHVLTPIISGRIEGGAPDKVFYFRCPDNSLRGFRIFAGDILLIVPEDKVSDGSLMFVEYKGVKAVRKLLKLDGARVQLQSYDAEFKAEVLPRASIRVIGRCVKLQRSL